MNFRVYCAMEVGPRENQEDCVLIQQEVIQTGQDEISREFSSTANQVLAVCDGMGGLAAGEKASRFVCENLTALANGSDRATDIRGHLEKIQLAMTDDFSEECGTTVAGMLAAPDGLQVFNLGDSRVYRVSTGKPECLSYDHSIVQVLLDEGEITDKEAFTHPYRNLITAGLGPCFAYKWALDTIHLKTETIAPAGGSYLICSDGVCDVLTDSEIGAALGDHPVNNGPVLMDALKKAFLKDNTTFIIVEIQP